MSLVNSHKKNSEEKIICKHCGEDCGSHPVQAYGENFCCNGCKTVYGILAENQLCEYYNYDDKAGKKVDRIEEYAYLDLKEVIDKLTEFQSKNLAKVQFKLPSIHCSSCIWLLERLHTINPGVLSSRVNFVKKTVHIDYNPQEITLRELAELLSSVGYAPQINYASGESESSENNTKKLLYKIGVAGFVFGNTMLFSFPEYIMENPKVFAQYEGLFRYLNLIFILPAFFYSGFDYIVSAWKSLKNKSLILDVPIALGMFALLLRSNYEVIFDQGSGYFDSLAGFIFFLLLGKYLQELTYSHLSFENDYKSYFPLAVKKIDKEADTQRMTLVDQLVIGDEIIIRYGEIVPADAFLLTKKAEIDYSFVTGEADPEFVGEKELVFAGGRNKGKAIRLIVQKPVNESYLTELWNKEVFSKKADKPVSRIANKVSQIFTPAILILATLALIVWYFIDSSLAITVFTAVLIVACPCALSLSIPFTFGTAQKVLATNRFFVKNQNLIENFSEINHIVFDKTGTLTDNRNYEIEFFTELDEEAQSLVYSLAKQSAHPVSEKITDYFKNAQYFEPQDYVEEAGKGIRGFINGHAVQIISSKHTEPDAKRHGTDVIVDSEFKTRIYVKNSLRKGVAKMVSNLKENGFKVTILSGDNEKEQKYLEKVLGADVEMYFRQSPHDKLEFVKKMQQTGEKVMMLGDGLNDAGALKQSDFGVAITEDIGQFSPAADAISEAKALTKLSDILKYVEKSKKLIFKSYLMSLFYNLFGLTFALSGQLTPVVAAILMPISSISVVAFTSLTSIYFAKKGGFQLWT